MAGFCGSIASAYTLPCGKPVLAAFQVVPPSTLLNTVGQRESRAQMQRPDVREPRVDFVAGGLPFKSLYRKRPGPPIYSLAHDLQPGRFRYSTKTCAYFFYGARFGGAL